MVLNVFDWLPKRNQLKVVPMHDTARLVVNQRNLFVCISGMNLAIVAALILVLGVVIGIFAQTGGALGSSKW